jgi:glycosyltransferase involved in cell wall biosynthesis
VADRRVAAIVPARNEASRVSATVSALRSIPGVDEVIVVDDASLDETRRLATEAGARTIRVEHRLGKGAALALGASQTDADVLLFVDADLAGTAREAERLLRPVLSGTADLAIAAIPSKGGPSGFGLVEGAARWGIRALTRRVLKRPLSGQRALRRDVLRAALPFAYGFGVEPAMTVDALRAGFRVIEVPCDMDHARTGRTLEGFAHRARQGAHIGAALLQRAARRGSR